MSSTQGPDSGGYGSMPSAPPVGQPVAVTRPKSVDLAVQLLWALVGLSVVSTLLSLLQRDEIREQVEKNDSSLTPSEVDTAVAVGLGFVIVVGLLGAALWALNAVFVGRGANWARIFTTVLVVLGVLLTLVSLSQATALALVLTLVSLVLSIGAAVLLWRKESSAFFTASRRR